MLLNVDFAVLASMAVVGICTFMLVSYLQFQETSDTSTSPPSQSILWTLFYHWLRPLKPLLSFTLSTSEQSIFEEEFKYLIVTSSLFNETPQPASSSAAASAEHHKSASSTLAQPAHIHTSNVKQKQKIKDFSNIHLTVSLIATNAICSAVSMILMNQFRSMLPVVLGSDIMTCYFIIRHHKRVQIRKIHASALDSMHEIISLSQESDTMLNRLLKVSNDHQQHQQLLGSLLSSHFETFVETVQQLQPLIDNHNLSRLRDMYNINEDIPSMLLEFDSHQYKPEDVDLIHSVIVWKRREYLLYLLALDVMSNNRTARYGKIWSQAIQVNHNLVREYLEFNKKLSVMSAEMSDSNATSSKKENDKVSLAISTQSDTSKATDETSISDSRCITLMHRVSVVEKHMEDIQAKLFLCKQDTKSLASGRVSSFSLKRISKRFSYIDESMNSLIKQWEESKHSLDALLEEEQSRLKSTFTSLPSPPSSPRDFRQNVYSAEEESNTSLMSQMTKHHSHTAPL
ncbi:hypothetical protein MAM1_0008c00923 [Mucor ambiguus]|uniref:Myosin-binding domain-containing protein n=1 Tax=Mucor ambiguus TaxID=91626 RepID=A0A0C9LQH8_9FUNG|nr:hypothetical protein MAM1_0008c00923 [Mucor ambiguus]